MVNWEKVQELRAKGWGWGDIAEDPSVDFHPDASAGDPGRALRALYHRSGRRIAASATPTAAPKKLRKDELERKWTLLRIGYVAVPLIGLWALFAYVAPSPIGILVPAIPYLALALVVAAFVLIYALYRRTEGKRWSVVYRSTVVTGVVAGLILAGGIGLAGTLIFGCPYLPPASALSGAGGSGWSTGPLPTWHSSGNPAVFFYGATWCPYCSASSWAIYKALSLYGSVSNAPPSHSSSSDVYPGTPEVVLAGITMGLSKAGYPAKVAFLPAEDTSGIKDTYPTTASCIQQAYVTAYASGIPFLVVGGQYIHLGTLVDPANLTPWNLANGSGLTSVVRGDVINETGAPWSAIKGQAWLITAFVYRSLGNSCAALSTMQTDYGWKAADVTGVGSVLGCT